MSCTSLRIPSVVRGSIGQRQHSGAGRHLLQLPVGGHAWFGISVNMMDGGRARGAQTASVRPAMRYDL